MYIECSHHDEKEADKDYLWLPTGKEEDINSVKLIRKASQKLKDNIDMISYDNSFEVSNSEGKCMRDNILSSS